jgi:hypothetical protein
LENYKGLGMWSSCIPIALNYFIVASNSSISISRYSCRFSLRAMKPKVLLLTADCLRKESVP